MMVILMSTPSIWGTHSFNWSSLVPSLGFQWWDWIAFSWLLATGSPRNPQTIKLLQQRVTLHRLTAGLHCRRGQSSHNEFNTEKLSWYLLVSFTPKFQSHFAERYVDTNTETQPLISSLFCLQKMQKGNGGKELVGVANQGLIWFMAHSMKRNLYPTLLSRPEIVQIPRLKPNTTGLKKARNWFLVIFCYTSEISAILSNHQRGLTWQPIGTEAENHCQTLCRKHA